MNNLRHKFERFCYLNRNKGIPNLMMYICIGNAIVYLISTITGNTMLYGLLLFDRTSILHGQVWRLLSYPLTMYSPNLLLMFVYLFCYYSLGQAMENQWGTLKFNLFYLSGIVMMDVYSLIFACQADVYYLNMSLFLSFSTMYPQASFLLFFIIPIKAWAIALFDLFILLMGVFTSYFPYNVFPLIALANYFLFFGSDVMNLIPQSWQRKLGRKPAGPKVIQFRTTERPQQKKQDKPAYNHRCTVCGRTDVSNPELEFRYCSRCKGYYCYCEEHIGNHVHIQ